MEISKNDLAMIFISTFGYLVWLLAFPVFGPIADNYLGGLRALSIEKGRFIQLFLTSMILSSVASGYIVDKLKKRLILIWLTTLVASLLTFSFLWLNRISEIFLFSFMLGLAAGMSPAALGSFFSDHVSPEDRGRVMSLPVGLSMSIAYLFLMAESFDLTNTVIMIITSMYLITIFTLVLKPNETVHETSLAKGRKGVAIKQVVYYASPLFLFYWVVGILFSMVFPTVRGLVTNQVFYLVWAIPFMFGSFLGGILLDAMGRKLPMIMGLAITGVSLAIFGVLGISLGYPFIISLAIGFSLVMVSSFIVWADLAPINARGIYYGAGTGLMAFGMMVGLFSTGTIFGSTSVSEIKSYILFSSVALFLCIPPLIMAEDVLPKELIEKRKLQEYLELAKRKYVRRD
jgi:MFS family permease